MKGLHLTKGHDIDPLVEIHETVNVSGEGPCVRQHPVAPANGLSALGEAVDR